jgi:hypothetical protein
VNEIDMRLRLRRLDEKALREWVKSYPVTNPVDRASCIQHHICPECGAGTRLNDPPCGHKIKK